MGLVSEPPTQLRVLVADDHELTRFSLKVALAKRSDVRVVGIACNGAEAVRLCQQHQTDVAIVDLHMPVMDGFRASAAIKALQPHARIIAYSSADKPQDSNRAGAIDVFCGKDAPTEELLGLVTELGLQARQAQLLPRN
ncbi:response regulator receiver protein [Rubidibacter lacunae KORDI 51-2]|uniref:Response regulator receiver protein n=1 Tax=Rubidibacter lacunae KORDI 51-2 TaxID=582515 RepID=U5DJC3_9CHRO|nr:response regulator transcription factor [Rubidibacter lacunae]ERN39785.1 response regulator receiver protein [Rubidibacter lacunae KORDI 51-2]